MRVNVYSRYYQLRNGKKRWFLIVREAGRKEYYIQLGCVNRTAAEQRRVMVLNEILNGNYQREPTARLYFSEFCDKFIGDFAQGARAPKTIVQYRHHLEKAKQAFVGYRLDQVRREDIERYLNGLNVSGRTKNVTLSVLRLLFQKAMDWRYLLSSHAYPEFPPK